MVNHHYTRLCNLYSPETGLDSNRLGLYVDTVKSFNFIIYSDHYHLAANGRLIFRSYFNSFYPSFWSLNTGVKRVFFKARGHGQGTASVWSKNGLGERLIASAKIFNGEVELDIDLSTFGGNKPVFMWLEIEANTPLDIFDPNIATNHPPSRDVNLLVVICAYQRDAFVIKTIDRLLAFKPLQDLSWRVLIIDQGQTLSDKHFDNRIKLLRAENRGGSGGFARGLQLASEDASITHILLMDDDVLIEPESIYRVIRYFAYSQPDKAIAGALLDEQNPTIMHELGGFFTRRGRPFQSSAGFKDLDLCRHTAWLKLSTPREVDYGGFWFFALPSSCIAKTGLPLPLFKKVDDMEYGLRLRQSSGISIITAPGLAIWHRVFRGEQSPVDTYYYLRNFLIIHAIYQRHLPVTLAIWMGLIFFRAWMRRNIPRTIAVQLALQHYLLGPDFHDNMEPAEKHKRIAGELMIQTNIRILSLVSGMSWLVIRNRTLVRKWACWARSQTAVPVN